MPTCIDVREWCVLAHCAFVLQKDLRSIRAIHYYYPCNLLTCVRLKIVRIFGKAAAAARTALTIPTGVCSVFLCLYKQWRDCLRLGFLTCAQMLMHAIAHGGCTNTATESALKVDSGRKIPCRSEELTRSLFQYCAWPFGPTLYHSF